VVVEGEFRVRGTILPGPIYILALGRRFGVGEMEVGDLSAISVAFTAHVLEFDMLEGVECIQFRDCKFTDLCGVTHQTGLVQ